MMACLVVSASLSILLRDGKGYLIPLSNFQKKFSDPRTVMSCASGSWAKLTASLRRVLVFRV
jgi:hypothetical protein